METVSRMSRSLGNAKVKVTLPVLLIVLAQVLSVNSMCSNGTVEVHFNDTEIHCCSKCQIGSGVTLECTPNDDTQCITCIEGTTFSDVESASESCKQCSTCDNSKFIRHPCNETHNAVCECPDGMYYDPDVDLCKFCVDCPAGWGASRKCNTYHNTICTQCVTNVTFSSNLDYFSSCETCTECNASFFTLQECSTSEDTICMNKDIMKHFTPGPGHNFSTPTVYVDDHNDDSDIIPVYCSLLGLVVIGLLGYVIFKHYSRMRTKRRHKGPCTHEDVEYAKAAGGDSGVFVESDSSPQNYTYCLASRIRDLPAAKRKEVEKVLSQPHSDAWKHLALQLGYSHKRLAQFETKRTGDTVSGFKHMLHDWERRETSTVSCFMQCLSNIGREDVNRILYIDSTEGRTQLLARQHSFSASQSNMV